MTDGCTIVRTYVTINNPSDRNTRDLEGVSGARVDLHVLIM